jgi:protein associated with RNAse G/E
MQMVKVLSRKYNGQLRDEYEAVLVAEDADMIQLMVRPGTPAFDHRKGKWIDGPDGMLEIYFKTRWLIVWHMCEKQSPATNNVYAHIAMPAQLHGGRLEWTDLDLDYRVHADGRVEPLDEDEFEHNRIAMGYPESVVVQARSAFEAAGHLCRAGVYPFNYFEQVERYQRLKPA